jgi:hypothetical protein
VVSPQLLKLAPLPLNLVLLLLKLGLVIRFGVLPALELVADDIAAQGSHSSTDRRASAWRADCRANNRTAGCTQAAS